MHRWICPILVALINVGVAEWMAPTDAWDKLTIILAGCSCFALGMFQQFIISED